MPQLSENGGIKQKVLWARIRIPHYYRDFIIYYKRKILQFSTMEKSTREMIKNMSHDIINECCICYESNVEMTGCESCTANFCIPCGIKLLNDNYELFCPCCKRFLFKLEL